MADKINSTYFILSLFHWLNGNKKHVFCFLLFFESTHVWNYNKYGKNKFPLISSLFSDIRMDKFNHGKKVRTDVMGIFLKILFLTYLWDFILLDGLYLWAMICETNEPVKLNELNLFCPNSTKFNVLSLNCCIVRKGAAKNPKNALKITQNT